MAQIISIFILKGGTGKTFLTFTLGGVLAAPKERGFNKRVLLIDCDPQGDLTKQLLQAAENSGPTLKHFFDDDSSLGLKDCIQNVEQYKLKQGEPEKTAKHYRNLDLIPTRPGSLRFFQKLDDECILRFDEELRELSKRYDYIIIDCTNQTEPCFNMALIASNYVIIPATCDVKGLESYLNTKRRIATIQKRMNPHLKIMGVVGNLYTESRKMERDFFERRFPDMMKTEGDYLFRSAIKDMSPYKNSINFKVPINIFEPPSSDANKNFKQFVEEIYEHFE